MTKKRNKLLDIMGKGSANYINDKTNDFFKSCSEKAIINTKVTVNTDAHIVGLQNDYNRIKFPTIKKNKVSSKDYDYDKDSVTRFINDVRNLIYTLKNNK